MSFKMCVLGSGSSGNCTVVWTETEALLIDCGKLSYRYVMEQLSALEIPARRIKGMVITHAHSDHIGRTAVLLARKHDIPIYLHGEIYNDIITGSADFGLEQLREDDLVGLHAQRRFTIGAFEVHPFSTHHRGGCVTLAQGFCIVHDGKKIGYITDCGTIDNAIVSALSGSHAAVIEANHDVEMVKNGPRPWPVKQWVLSDDGHLSNPAAAELIARIGGARQPLRQVLLAHVSEAHNVLEDLAGRITHLIGDDTVKLYVTYHHARSEIIEIGDGLK